MAASDSSAQDFAAPFAHHFDYGTELADPVRDDLPAAHRRAWARLAQPGTWWTAEERIAIAAESRAAVYCTFCRERKESLSPFFLQGEHDHVSGTCCLLPGSTRSTGW